MGMRDVIKSSSHTAPERPIGPLNLNRVRHTSGWAITADMSHKHTSALHINRPIQTWAHDTRLQNSRPINSLHSPGHSQTRGWQDRLFYIKCCMLKCNDLLFGNHCCSVSFLESGVRRSGSGWLKSYFGNNLRHYFRHNQILPSSCHQRLRILTFALNNTFPVMLKAQVNLFGWRHTKSHYVDHTKMMQ